VAPDVLSVLCLEGINAAQGSTEEFPQWDYNTRMVLHLQHGFIGKPMEGCHSHTYGVMESLPGCARPSRSVDSSFQHIHTTATLETIAHSPFSVPDALKTPPWRCGSSEEGSEGVPRGQDAKK